MDPSNPPETLNTDEMRQAMKVLYRFSENEADYLLYQSRMDAVLKENTYISELEEAMEEKEKLAKALAKEKKQAAKEKEQAVKEKEKLARELAREKEQAQKKINELLLLLEKKGIDPEKVLM